MRDLRILRVQRGAHEFSPALAAANEAIALHRAAAAFIAVVRERARGPMGATARTKPIRQRAILRSADVNASTLPVVPVHVGPGPTVEAAPAQRQWPRT